jgi:hypothetical protein
VRPISFFRAPDRADGRRSAAPSLADDPAPTSSPCVSGGDRRRFQFCIERFQNLGRLILQLSQPCHSCGFAHGQPRPFTTSCGFAASEPLPFPGANSIFSTCCGAISRRLRFAVRPSRAAIPATETPLFKDRHRPGDLRRDGAVRTNIERLRNSGKKFVEPHDQSHGVFLIASVAASRSSAKRSSEPSSD